MVSTQSCRVNSEPERPAEFRMGWLCFPVCEMQAVGFHVLSPTQHPDVLKKGRKAALLKRPHIGQLCYLSLKGRGGRKGSIRLVGSRPILQKKKTKKKPGPAVSNCQAELRPLNVSSQGL